MNSILIVTTLISFALIVASSNLRDKHNVKDCKYWAKVGECTKKNKVIRFFINGLGHKQKSWVKCTMGGVSYRNFWTSIPPVREIIRGCLLTEL